jgi:putative ABC transport system ATP-binding protein
MAGITLERVSKFFDDGVAGVRDLDLHVLDGEFVVLVGPSGSGKSTLLRCCNRLESPEVGVVRFRGDDVAALDPLALRRRVGMVFQRPTPFPGTCLENLRVADAALTREDAAALLAHMRLEPSFLDREATQLSGGEAQRLCLARSLAARPEVVLMDEVTSSLDGTARGALEELARDLSNEGVRIVWVTHDFAQVQRIADHVVVVLRGHIADRAEADAFVEEARGGK